jgi:hypothetical protein
MIYTQPTIDVTPETRHRNFSIAWLFPHADLARDPSNRLRRYQISNELNGMHGIVKKSTNFFFYDKKEDIREQLLDYDVVVLFNINDFDLGLLLYLKEKGIIVIFDHSENIFGLGHEDEIMKNVSAITCCSVALARNTHYYLSSRFNIDKPIFVIRDPIEDSSIHYPTPYPTGENTALVMGMGANVRYVLPTLEKYCKEAGYRMLILTEVGFSFPGHQIEFWTPYNWMDVAMQCSVALCFHSITQFPAKGNVKATAPMSIGLPVIAVPIDSYREAVMDSYNGFIALDDAIWVNSLNALKNKGLRQLMGLRARQSVITNYSTSKICLDYLSMVGFLQT